MVDSIKNTISRIDPQQVRAKSPSVNPNVKSSSVASAASAGPEAATASSVHIKSMASQPPVDTEAVSRIKEAIKRGEYPVNLDQISDALMDAYRDLKG